MAQKNYGVEYGIGYKYVGDGLKLSVGDIAVVGSSMGWITFVKVTLGRIDTAANPIVEQNNRYFHVQTKTAAKGHRWVDVICVGQYWSQDYENYRQIAINNMNTGVYLFAPVRPANIAMTKPYDIQHPAEKFHNDRVFAGEFRDEWKDMAVQCALYDAIWRPNTFGALCARSIIAPLTVGLSVLVDRYGKDHTFAMLTREYRDKCREFPDALVRLGAVDQQTADHTKKITGMKYY